MKALLVTYYRFPNGDAGSVRQETLAKLFADLGYDITVIGMGKHTDFKLMKYKFMDYVSFRSSKNDIIHRVGNICFYKKHLKDFLIEKNNFDIILVVDVPVNALFYLKKYAKLHKIKLIHDSVEWYSKEQFKLGKLSLPYVLKNMYNTKWIDKQFKVISISAYLENHFSSRGISTTRVPAILDVSEVAYQKRTKNNKTTYIYAGSPGKKDYLNDIICGFSLLSKKDLEKIEVRIIGITKEQLVTSCGVTNAVIDFLGNSLVCLGRISRDDVFKNLEEADFTVLLRVATQRYAIAGFPTKVPESLATATPVICNLTSDLGMYIKDHENGFIVDGCNPEALARVIKKTLALSIEEKAAMQNNARMTAEKYFDVKNFTEKMRNFIE